MAYQRPKNRSPLSKVEKLDLLKNYIEYYNDLAAIDATVLNRKLPREAFATLLDLLDETLLNGSKELAETDGPVLAFLEANPLPPVMAAHLPVNFRVFCLALNSLKQW